MARIIIIGSGWSGCAAAIAAKKTGADVIVLEKTDLLLGLGNVGGIMRNNGRYTATEENIAMGAGELFDITDRCSLHKNVDFPGHNHASFYDAANVEPMVERLLNAMGIEFKFMSRAVDVIMSKINPKEIEGVVLASGETIEGEGFIDCTGTAGPMGNCTEYGNGCSMCILRCPAFGPRVSISRKAGGHDFMGQRADGQFGAFSGSCKLEKRSLSDRLQKELNKKGVVIVPLPAELIHMDKLNKKVCRQYALPSFAENIVLIDTGCVKIMSPFFSLAELRKVEGFENACFNDPYAGGKGNSIRYMAVTERDDFLKVRGVDNLFCAGEKAGLFIGHTEAISTGTLAGYNCGQFVLNKEMLVIPNTLAVGKLINHKNRCAKMMTFAGDSFFEEMKAEGLYITNKEEIGSKVSDAGLQNVYSPSCKQVKNLV